MVTAQAGRSMVTVRWQVPAGGLPTGAWYVVRATTGAGESMERWVAAPATVVTLRNLLNGIEYVVAVRVQVGDQASPWSKAVVATPSLEEPAEVDGLIVVYEPGVAPVESVDRATGSADLGTVALLPDAPIALGMRTVEFSEPVSEATAEALADKLAADPRVAWAEPDVMIEAPSYPALGPNDPYFRSAQMWNLTSANGIRAREAWAVTTGTPDVVVAVIDTGIVRHPDLDSNVVPGYDMVSDLSLAVDGNGRDPDASDPGYGGWHGTHVAGTIAAVTDNGIGISGVAPNVRVQSVRVLGRGGGRLSDAVAGIIWASGGTVAGVPANPTPAKVLNLSLGGGGSCSSSSSFQTAINAAVARGSVVVVAAGNSNMNAALESPASCQNVVTVASADPNGVRSRFSNFGAAVEIAAPGEQIWSTIDSGSSTPVAPSYAQYAGTSMAAPHVAGVVALMRSKFPSMTPVEVMNRIADKTYSTPFPRGVCDPADASKTCGAGLLNAALLLGGAAPAPGVPAAPTALVATPGDRSVSVAFTPPQGSGTILAYEYSVNRGGWVRPSPAVTRSPLVIGGLANYISHLVEIRAVNASGPGTPSVALSIVPFAPLGAPTNLVATPGDGSASIAFIPPVNDGGSPVLTYEYSVDGSDFVGSVPMSSVSPKFVRGLLNGRTHSIRLRAVTALGVGPSSAPVTVVPVGPLLAPTGIVAVPGDRSVSVSFVAPAAARGSAIRTIEFSLDDGRTWAARSPQSVSSPLVVTGLANGTTYQLRLRAVDAAGPGATSTSVVVVPRGPAAAPTNLVATPGDGTVSVAFVAPSSNGGSEILNYEVSLDDGRTWAARSPQSVSSPVVVTGLVNGTAYLFRLRAVNASGGGAPTSSVSVVPRTVPGAPTGVAVTSSNQSVSVAFVPPSSTGGDRISSYEYSLNGGSWMRVFGSSSPFTVSGLVNGTSYEVRVRAVNAAGPGAPSAPVTAVPRSVPAAPTNLVATPGDASVSVAFTPASLPSGAETTNLEYSTDGGRTWTARNPASTASPIVITGLANGVQVLVQLRAVNAVGAGSASRMVSAVPRTVPGAPTGLVATPGSRMATIAFVAPAFNGGAPVQRFEYSLDGTTWVAPWRSGSPVAVPNLVNGTPYQIRLRAVNAAGPGAASEPVTVVPRTVPQPPRVTSIVASGGTAVIGLVPPADNGGSPVTAYAYSVGGAPWVSIPPTATLTITGLARGRSHRVLIQAVSAVGPSTSVASALIWMR
ncbi:MAG: fibronectin type III domain-containing protein [Acidobacteria bacterium]|nr:fibronectin type III domain-containing protein [Acidobacteriota bacterium]